MRGYIHIEDACDQLQLTSADIRALAARGELNASGSYVSRASVERYATARARRFGELAIGMASYAHHKDSARLDRIYAAAATTIATEGTGGDGGFAVPATYSERILRPFQSGFNLVARCDQVTTPTNSICLPVDRRPPHDTSNGIVANYVGESGATPQSKPYLGAIAHKLKKIQTLVPVSEELLSDAPGLGFYLESAGAEALLWKASYDIAWGTGAGELLGFMNSPALVAVPIESGPQTTDTIVAANIQKMAKHMPASSRPTAVWLVHPDSEQFLVGMSINGQIVYTPGDAEAPCGRLLGAPIMPHELCSAVGDVGDIAFVDLQQYLLALKDPAMRTLTSLHFWFDRHLMAFKFTMRIDGMPAWSGPVESRVGGTSRSPFVTLAAR